MSITLAVCANFAEEAAAAVEAEGWTDVTIESFPANCGLPPLTQEDLDSLKRRGGADALIVVGSACCAGLSGGRSPDRVRQLEQCFHLVAQPELLGSRLSEGAYVVTPGWVRAWRRHVEHLGLDAATAPLLFGECARSVLLLDSGVDPTSGEHLAEFSGFVRLPSQSVHVGLGMMRLQLARVVGEARLELERIDSIEALSRTTRQSAHFAAAFDLIGRLVRIMTGDEALIEMRAVFEALFAAKRVSFDASGEQADTVTEGDILSSAPGEETGACVMTGDGFVVPVTYQGEGFGAIRVEGISFPEHRERYTELAKTIADVYGLALANARTYEKVKRTEEDLRALDETKNAFLSALSHDLRNPLVAIRGFAEVMQIRGDRLAPERAQEFVERIVSNADRMNRMIGDLLDLDRLGRGALALNRQPTDLMAIVRRTVAEAELQEHSVEIDAEQVVVASVDPVLVERIVDNLLRNASRHTPKATPVWIRLRNQDGGVLMMVEDAGPGVPEDMRDTIFEPFRRGRNPQSAGSGVGLSLVARFAELHGGRAWVEDRPGGGASFRVLLPEQ